MITESEVREEFEKIMQHISTTIDKGESKHIFSDAGSGKTTAIIENIKRYSGKYFIVFAPTKAVMGIYRRELQGYKNYKLLDARTSQKTECMQGLINCVVCFDDIDMMLAGRQVTKDELHEIELIAKAKRASVITTSRS